MFDTEKGRSNIWSLLYSQLYIFLKYVSWWNKLVQLCLHVFVTGAALTSADPEELQKVIEETNVRNMNNVTIIDVDL